MFHTRLKTTLTLLLLPLALAVSFLIGPLPSAAASSGPDFSISANPTSQTIERGGTAIYAIHVQALSGFTGMVNLTVTGVPNHDSGSFTNASVTGTGDTQLNVHSAGHQSPLGTATLTITGTSGSVQHAIQVTYQVIPVPDFSFTSTNASLQTIKRGTTAVYLMQVSVVPGSGFSGTVTFGVASGLPANSTASFTAGSVVVPGSTELDIHTTAQTPIGSFTVIATGTSGSLVHDLFLTLEVLPPISDFSISASPTSQTIQSANGAIYTAHIGAINGFNGTVTFTLSGLPPFTNFVFGGNGTVTGSGDLTMYLFTSSGVTGTFHITITATSGPLQHTVQVTLIMK